MSKASDALINDWDEHCADLTIDESVLESLQPTVFGCIQSVKYLEMQNKIMREALKKITDREIPPIGEGRGMAMSVMMAIAYEALAKVGEE